MSHPRPVTEEPRSKRVPDFLYGTAWKKDETQRLTELAIQQGFRAIDTANQRKHYYEAGVGQAVAASIKSGLVVREDLFLQTKFTFVRGQDHILPYDPAASIAVQVQQSFESSLEHLGVEYIDSYILHGPSSNFGLTADDWAAWQAMEDLYHAGRIRCLGISNVTLQQLQLLLAKARVPPRFVQNRCYAVHGWDHDVRKLCRDQKMNYQGFSLLTANPGVLRSHELIKMAKRYEKTVCQIVFRFAIDIGMIPLTGTTDEKHMSEDLEVLDFCLSPEDTQEIAGLATG